MIMPSATRRFRLLFAGVISLIGICVLSACGSDPPTPPTADPALLAAQNRDNASECEALYRSGDLEQAFECTQSLLGQNRLTFEVLSKLQARRHEFTDAINSLDMIIQTIRLENETETAAIPYILQAAEFERILGRFRSSLNRYADVIDAARVDGDRLAEARAKRGIAELYNHRGDAVNALEPIVQAIRIFEEEGLRDEIAASALVKARAHMLLSNYEEATLSLSEAESHRVENNLLIPPRISLLKAEMAIRRQIASPVEIENHLGDAETWQKNLEESVQQTDPESREQPVDPLLVEELAVRIDALYGLHYREQNKMSLAQEHYNKAITRSDESNLLDLQASCTNGLALVYFYEGRFDRAEEFFTQAAEIREQMQDEANLAGLYFSLGVVKDQQGDLEGAVEYLRRAVEIEARLDMPQLENDRSYLEDLETRLAGQDRPLRQDIAPNARGGSVQAKPDEPSPDDSGNTKPDDTEQKPKPLPNSPGGNTAQDSSGSRTIQSPNPGAAASTDPTQRSSAGVNATANPGATLLPGGAANSAQVQSEIERRTQGDMEEMRELDNQVSEVISSQSP